MKVFKHCIVLLCLQLLGLSAALAEINWQQEETLDTQIPLPIRSVAVASDGALWRTYSTAKTTYVERINMQTGLITGKMQLNINNYELAADTADGNMWFASYLGASLISPSLQTLEERSGFAFSLPANKSFTGRQIATRGKLATKTAELINASGHSIYFGNASAGLWVTDFQTRAIAQINIETGRAARPINSVCAGDLNTVLLSANRAFSSYCLIDLISGDIIRPPLNGGFLFGLMQYTPGYLVSFDQLKYRIHAANTGTEVWSLSATSASQIIITNEKLIVRNNSRLMGFNIDTGSPIFDVSSPSLNEGALEASDNFIIINRSDRTDIYSPKTGALLHSILANPVQPIAYQVRLTYSNDAVYLTSLIYESQTRSFIQITKRRLLDGSIVWRKTIQHQLTMPGTCGWLQCGDIGITGSASENSFVLSAKLQSGATIHSTVMSLASATGLVQWRQDADFSSGVTNGALLDGINFGNVVQLSRVLYENSAHITEIVDAVSGNLLWTSVENYFPLFQGDFLRVDGRALERIDGRSGQLKWRNINADIDLNELLAVTSDEISYRARDSIWSPISFAQLNINRVNLETGQISPQSMQVSSDFVRATGVQYFFSGVPVHMQTALAIRLFKAPSILTNYLIITPSGAHVIDRSSPSQRFVMRPRGLGVTELGFRDDDPSYGLAGSFLYWMDDFNAAGIKLNLWQPLPPERYYGPEKYVAKYEAKTISAPRIILEREFNGSNIRYLISKVSAIDAPESKVALKISKRFIEITQQGEYRYMLRVENTGRNPVAGAQVLSEFANVNSFTCVATHGSCNQTSRLGAFSFQLDLLPGGFADLAVLDASTHTNLIGVIAPPDTVESDISDNLVELGRNSMNVIEFANGFE